MLNKKNRFYIFMPNRGRMNFNRLMTRSYSKRLPPNVPISTSNSLNIAGKASGKINNEKKN